MRRIGAIHSTHAAGGANDSPWWWCLWVVLCWVMTLISYYSYPTKPMEQEFFVSAQTPIVVKLLMHFWMDLIEPVYLSTWGICFSVFLKSYGEKCVFLPQALWGGLEWVWNSAINPIPDLLNSGNRNFIFLIIKCVPTNSEHDSSSSESSPAIWFFPFHESENIPTIYVSGKWHQISILNVPICFAHTIAKPLLTISTWYTQIYENLIDVSRYRHHCWGTK